MDEKLISYKGHLEEIVIKSQDSFEKQLSYISAGSLSVSMAFIKNVVGDLKDTRNEVLLLMAWGLMGVTLLINLLSHVYTSNCHNKTISEINDGKYDHYKALCRHNNIKRWNYVSIGTLILGINLLLLFIHYNI